MDIPKTMRAAAIDRFGGPDEIKLHELPVPTIDPGEVLMALHTAGVGSWDPEIREGRSASPDTPFPLILGVDGSGTIVRVGEAASRFNIDDQVYSYNWDNPKGGFYAEFVAVPADKVAPIPSVVDLKQAGAMATTGLTALQGIDDALHLQPGEIIFINGASGGVGSLAVQFAKLRGARVVACASGPDGVDLVRRLGADDALDRDDAGAMHRFETHGFDAILALAGGTLLDRAIPLLRPGGRLAYPYGVEPEPKKPETRPDIVIQSYSGESGVTQFEALNRAAEQARLQVPIAAEFPLERAAEAHERLAAHHVLGRIALAVR
jgi:NADPH2:quinone reductase